MKRKIILALSTTLIFTVVGCNNNSSSSKWNYTKEDTGSFSEFDADLSFKDDKVLKLECYMDYQILKTTEVTSDDVLVFNYSALQSDVEYENLSFDYLDYQTISKYKMDVDEIKVNENKNSINIQFTANDNSQDLYYALLSKDITLNGNYAFIDGVYESIGDDGNDTKENQLDFEESFVQSDSGSWNAGKTFINIVGAIATLGIGIYTGQAAVGVGAVLSLFNLFGDSLCGDSVSNAQILAKLNEVDNRLIAVSKQIEANTALLEAQEIYTQAKLDQQTIRILDNAITAFNTDYIEPISDLIRNTYTDYLGKQLVEFVSKNESVDLYYRNNESTDNKPQCVASNEVDTDTDTKYTYSFSDFTNAKQFLKGNNNTVSNGFMDAFYKDIAKGNNLSNRPEGIDEDTLVEHIVCAITNQIMSEYFKNNVSTAQELRNKVINLSNRIAGTSTTTILDSYTTRIESMYNFHSEVKDSLTCCYARIKKFLVMAAGLASQACIYASIDQKEMCQDYEAACKLIKKYDDTKNATKDNYCYTINQNILGNLFTAKYNVAFTNQGNHPNFSANFSLREVSLANYDVKYTDRNYSDYNIINYEDQERVVTRYKILYQIGGTTQTSYLRYLENTGILDGNAYKTLDYLKYIRYVGNDCEKILTGFSVRDMNGGDTSFTVGDAVRGGDSDSYYFNDGWRGAYGSRYESDSWSGKIVETKFLDGTSGTLMNDARVACYALYREDHWYWRHDETWALVDNPAGNYFFMFYAAN